AAVFLWFGIDKFIHPSYWLNAWVPQWFVDFIGRFGTSGLQFIYLNGVFEVLVGVSLLSGFLMRFFSFLSVLFLAAILFIAGFSEVTVRDLGLIGGFLSLLFWPRKRF
ncbi:MAG: DoxX family membrane protein, partial [Candidatus Yanofskybacteria bacterium]|nr:DoxX family membrane protein [Candidatus Yanofskybacteria bacterium]